MTTFLPQCINCTRYRKSRTENTCDAFPRGIPKKILFNRIDHRHPVEGDHGLQYEARNPQLLHPFSEELDVAEEEEEESSHRSSRLTLFPTASAFTPSGGFDR